MIDQVCEAETGKGGEWILKFDVVNEKDTLKLKRQSKDGACRRECKTIADSCQDQLDSFDNLDDLQVHDQTVCWLLICSISLFP